MPKMVQMVLAKGYEAKTPADKAAVAAFKPFTCSYIQAIQNIQNSKGMLTIAEEAPVTQTAGPRRLEDMDFQELKHMMLAYGVTPTKKKMTREEVMVVLRKKMDEFDIVEGDDASE